MTTETSAEPVADPDTGAPPGAEEPGRDELGVKLAPATEESCGRCGAPMEEDQEWCLRCGTARTILDRPPDWRIPAGLVAAVIVAALVAFAIALVNLSGGSGATTTTVTVRAATPKPAAPTPAGVASWPVGLAGWTVVLADSPSEATADATARHLQAGGLNTVGVLDTRDHPAMARLLGRDLWIVYADRYPDAAAAQAAASRLASAGHTGAVAREVAPPGGL